MCCKTIIIISFFQYFHGRVYMFCWKCVYMYSKMCIFVSKLVSIGPGLLRNLRPPDRRRISAPIRFRAGSLQFQNSFPPNPYGGKSTMADSIPRSIFRNSRFPDPQRGAYPQRGENLWFPSLPGVASLLRW